MTKLNDRRSGGDPIPLKQLQAQLEQAANPNTKAWFETDLKVIIADYSRLMTIARSLNLLDFVSQWITGANGFRSTIAQTPYSG